MPKLHGVNEISRCTREQVAAQFAQFEFFHFDDMPANSRGWAHDYAITFPSYPGAVRGDDFESLEAVMSVVWGKP